MIHFGLSAADMRAYRAALSQSYTMRTTVEVQSLEGDTLRPITARVTEGFVTVDADAQITRSLTLSLNDPRRTLNFDAYSPADGALYADRMVRVLYGARLDSLGWVDVPVFTGPVDSFQRQGNRVDLTAMGKEMLALGFCFRPLTLKKGMKKTDAIRTILRERAGESKLAIPDLRARLRADLSLGAEDQPWVVATRVAGSLNRQLYYDANGWARLRPHPRQPVFTFRTGKGGVLQGDPSIAFDVSQVKNAVVVRGGKPRGIKKKTDTDPSTPKPKDLPIFRGRAVADRNHPLSPWNVGRRLDDGTIIPRYLVETITDSTIRSQREADAVAERRLRELLNTQVQATADSMPIPFLDPLDMARIVTDDFSCRIPLRQFTLPLTPTTMSVGYLRGVDRPSRGRIR